MKLPKPLLYIACSIIIALLLLVVYVIISEAIYFISLVS